MDLFIPSALQIEPRLKEVDFDFCEVMDPETDFAFISGSVVEGFGNRSSDVDIYVISNKDTGFPEGKKCNYTNAENGYYYEINWYSQKWHDSLGQKINSVSLEDIKNKHTTLDELNYYYRCTIGYPLINEKSFQARSQMYSKEHINHVLKYHFGYKAFKNYKMALELKENGELEQSYYWYSQAIASIVDSFLASNGEGYPSGKFRFEKIRRFSGEESKLYKDAKRLRYLGDYSISEYINQAESYLKAMNVEQFNIDDFIPRYRIVGMVELFSLYNDYLVLNAGNVYQIDKYSQEILSLISNGFDSRTELISYISKQSPNLLKNLNDILHQLQYEGIIEIC